MPGPDLRPRPARQTSLPLPHTFPSELTSLLPVQSPASRQGALRAAWLAPLAGHPPPAWPAGGEGLGSQPGPQTPPGRVSEGAMSRHRGCRALWQEPGSLAQPAVQAQTHLCLSLCPAASKGRPCGTRPPCPSPRPPTHGPRPVPSLVEDGPEPPGSREVGSLVWAGGGVAHLANARPLAPAPLQCHHRPPETHSHSPTEDASASGNSWVLRGQWCSVPSSPTLPPPFPCGRVRA